MMEIRKNRGVETSGDYFCEIFLKRNLVVLGKMLIYNDDRVENFGIVLELSLTKSNGNHIDWQGYIIGSFLDTWGRTRTHSNAEKITCWTN